MKKKRDYSEELNMYIECMEEIKRRQNSISSFLTNERTTGFIYTNTEFICLQFRKILELIALANLVSNREEYAKKHQNFSNHYHAKHILRDIEKLNPNFYPTPTRQVIDEKTGIVVETVDVKDGFLTKEEFINIYDECSGLMHAENPFASPKNLEALHINFVPWLRKITIL